MNDGIKVEVIGGDKAMRAFAALDQRYADMRPAGERIAQAVRDFARHRFVSQGDGSWDDLTKAYAARKRKEYGEQPILKATGVMEKSLTVKDSDHSIYDAQTDSISVGTDLARARGHQFGVPGKNLVARPIFASLDPLAREAARITAEDLTAAYVNA